jgi:hypothetical protein
MREGSGWEDLVPGDGEGGRTVDGGVGLEPDLLLRHGQPQGRHTPGQGGQCGGQLQASDLQAEALVRSVPEAVRSRAYTTARNTGPLLIISP